MKKINIEIASVPDKDKLVAEIWHRKTLIADHLVSFKFTTTANVFCA